MNSNGNPIVNQEPQGNTTRKELSTELALGGQAIIEGVMMRSPDRVAMAVRTPDGSVATKSYPYTPVTRRFKLLGLPVIRGAVGLVESLKIGMDALNWSAQQATVDASSEVKEKAGMKEKLGIGLSMMVALVIGLGLFMYFPLWIGKLVAGGDGVNIAGRQVIVNVVAGVVRISLLLAYLWFISRWKDIHRVFQYHGSEHKSIFAYESGFDLTVDRVLTQTRFHPRCGTSFLLIVALAAVIFFVVVDSIVVSLFGDYGSVWARLAVHLPLIPILAGISYEFLKFSSKHTDNALVKILIQPGLWLQRITTQEPDPSMCEVAVTALNTALEGHVESAPAPVSSPETTVQS
ncbi:MAG TPA: DUF1385 domain-containing protein [bacterium]|jgi:uncharacterized protein YqhQ